MTGRDGAHVWLTLPGHSSIYSAVVPLLSITYGLEIMEVYIFSQEQRWVWTAPSLLVQGHISTRQLVIWGWKLGTLASMLPSSRLAMAGPASLSRGTGCSARIPWFTEGILRACVYVCLTLSLWHSWEVQISQRLISSWAMD